MSLPNFRAQVLWRRGQLPPKSALRGSREIGYGSAHGRVKALLGRASSYSCSSCSSVAREWAYLHVGDDPDLVVDDRGRAYSLNIDRYSPMCSPCHRAYDAQARR